MRRSLSPELRRAACCLLVALLCLFGCQHGPLSGAEPLGVAAMRSSGTHPGPSGVEGHPSPVLDNVTCPAYDASTLPAPLPASPTVAAGTIPGTFAVAPGGQATYTLPLAVPPGRLGMEPRLAIAYDSSRGEGPLGVGFALEGLSAITRCPSNMAQDGHIRAVRYDSDDKFCLDGLRLVPVPKSDGADGAGSRSGGRSRTRCGRSSPAPALTGARARSGGRSTRGTGASASTAGRRTAARWRRAGSWRRGTSRPRATGGTTRSTTRTRTTSIRATATPPRILVTQIDYTRHGSRPRRAAGGVQVRGPRRRARSTTAASASRARSCSSGSA